jgi:hypothetical protein
MPSRCWSTSNGHGAAARPRCRRGRWRQYRYGRGAVAKRLGVEEAILVYRRDRAHMRAEPYEADEAFLEGGQSEVADQPTASARKG